jgi:hypothetical protein
LTLFPAWDQENRIERGLLNLNNAAGDAGTGVTGRLRGEIISAGMNDDRPSDDGGFTGETEVVIDPFEAGAAIFIGLKVAQVTDMPFIIVRSGMGHSCGIEMTSGAGGIRRGTIAMFMNVESVLAICTQAGDLSNDPDAFRFPDKSDGAGRMVALGCAQKGDGFGGSARGRLSGAGLGMGMAVIMSVSVIVVMIMIVSMGGLLAGVAAKQAEGE